MPFRCRLLLLPLLWAAPPGAAQEEEAAVQFAFSSPAWGGDTVDGLRLIARNRTAGAVRLRSVSFLKDAEGGRRVDVALDLRIPAGGYADAELDYMDLLGDNECIARTLSGGWRLAEVSNHTLHPSVRNLIIEDTDTFRIYQCAETVVVRWTSLPDGAAVERRGWALFHFERRRGS